MAEQLKYNEIQLEKIYKMIRQANKEALEKKYTGIFASTTTSDKKPLKFLSRVKDKNGKSFEVYNANFDVHDQENKISFRLVVSKNYNAFTMEEIKALQQLLQDETTMKKLVGFEGYLRRNEQTAWINITSYSNSWNFKKEIDALIKEQEQNTDDKKKVEKVVKKDKKEEQMLF